MLPFALTAAPCAILLSAVIRICLLCRKSTPEPVQEPVLERTSQGLSYTVHAETGYRNSDNRYTFLLKRLPQGYRCYITRTPSYRERRTDATVTHRLRDRTGPYICYTASLPELEQAKTLCREWSNLTQRYIETGREFGE